MINDKAQELTAKITESINALCAETDAAKQSATYRAWLALHVAKLRNFLRYAESKHWCRAGLAALDAPRI